MNRAQYTEETLVEDVLGILKRAESLRVVNASGTVSRLGGASMLPVVTEAMREVATWNLDMGALQGYASEVISRCTGAEAGIVTSGAMAGLLVGSAACMTGMDPNKMSRLPDSTGMRNEFIVSRSHRNSFDHGVRAAGARLVEVGLPDRLNGCGPRDTEVWELASAIGDRTAGILYLARSDSRPDLRSVVRVAHAANIPVLVDAAAELPPASNLRRFIDEGADLVVFSGGKALGGPSGSGILCGRRSLIGSALLQQIDMGGYSDWQPPHQIIDPGSLSGLPRHGIGRCCKVGKEQIVGLLAALASFLREDDVARNERLRVIADQLMRAVGEVPGLRVQVVEDLKRGGMPVVEVAVGSDCSTPDASRLAARLRNATPPIHVDATQGDQGILRLVPSCLTTAEVGLIGAAFAAAISSGP